jgi:hypothetical protein
MNTNFRFTRLLHWSIYIVCLLALILGAGTLKAQWSSDPKVNTPVSRSSDQEWNPHIVSDGLDGAIIVWGNYAGAGMKYNITAQRLDAGGNIMWSLDANICAANHDQRDYRVISDGAGGAIITWTDDRNSTTTWDIYAQRVNASGQVLWTADGIPISTAVDVQAYPDLCSDGAGGAIITWRDSRNYSLTGVDIYAQRINASGVAQWTPHGVTVCAESGDQMDPRIISDGLGGAIITWTDDRNSTTDWDIYAQKINASGVKQWTASGVGYLALTKQTNPTIVSDGSGGAIIAWQDYYNGNDDIDIRALRINSAGEFAWTPTNTWVCGADGNQIGPIAVSDSAGGAIIVWTDYRNGISNPDIFIDRIDVSGASRWTAWGKPVCTAVDRQIAPDIISDVFGGVIITWMDERSDTSDIYAQRFDANGAPQWNANGLAISTAKKAQNSPRLTLAGTIGSIITWTDLRWVGDPFDDTDWDIYAQRVYGNGSLAQESIIIDVPNGGENWNVGSTRYIVWHNQNFNDPVKIEYSTDGGTNYSTIVASTTNSGSYTWAVPNTPSTNCLVKVSDAADGNPWDVSDSPFTISTSIGDNTNPGSNIEVNLGSGVNLTFDNVTGAGNTSLTTSITGPPAPGGFIIVPSGSPMYYDITTTATFTGNIKLYIQYNDAGMTTQEEAALKLHVYESGQWKDVTTSVDVNSNIICGTVSHLSDFAVMSPLASASITVIQPNGGENWVVGSEQEIKWTSTGFTDPVRIEYSIDGNASHLDVVSSTENDGSYLWVVPNTPSTNCVVIVSNATGGQPFDISDATFTISPVGSDNTQTGFDVTVTLNSNVSVTFDEVTTSGNTTLTTGHTGPEPPNNFVVHPQSDPLFNDINTTAGYAGLIHLSIHYDDTELDTEMEPNLGLYRFIESHSEWLGITTSMDIDNDFIYGTTDQLSIFAIMYQKGDPAENGLIVTNCDDAGPGSLRDAILYANNNPGQDTIRFQIPVGVPGHDADIGVWLIAPQSELPTITESIFIDGFSQREFIGGDTNPFGPEIWLNGEHAGQYVHGLKSTADGTTIVGLTISNFHYAGIGLHDVDGGRISGCYVGVDFAGNAAAANGWGIWLVENTRNVAITPIDTFTNVISGNTNGGIVVRDSSNHISIMGNIIGLNRSGMHPIGNSNYGGIHIDDQCDNVDVFDNWICGNRFGMIVVNSSNITIGNNFIGSNIINDETLELGNEYDGVWLAEGACDNVITENFIRFNGGSGVHIEGTNTIRNRVSHNHISGNGTWGIYNQSGGNLEIAAPVISNATATSITGTAVPNATVEIYTDPGYQGLLFQGETNSDASGNISWSGTISGPYTNVTAIAIDDSGNTSAFSQVALVTNVEKMEDSIIPETFSLSQNYPNPFNPETTIRFEIPSRGKHTVKVELCIYNLQGQLIRTLINDERSPGIYQVGWDGLDEAGKTVATGIYLYRIRAGEFAATKKIILIK